jgi:alkylhydroperoxidase/carboxymuconolactone decarboxylase family protein YurZ
MMMKEYFPDMTYATDCFIFGYLATGSLDVFSLQKTELIIATGITAMGATRQTRSHIKAAMQQGNSPVVVSAMVRAASKIMEWNGQLLGKFDVGALEKELHANLAKEDSGSGLPA